MSRTNSTLVEGILGNEWNGTTDLTPYIDTASSLVDDLVANASSLNITAPASGKLELIERWLSAHFYQQMDPGYQSKKTKDASGDFTGKTGMNLSSTRYGQSAMMLDTTGFLRQNQNVAYSAWLGKTYVERDNDPNTGWR